MLIRAVGAMVLGHSLRDKGAKAKMVVLATLDTLSSDTITELQVSILRASARGPSLITSDCLQ